MQYLESINLGPVDLVILGHVGPVDLVILGHVGPVDQSDKTLKTR